jgi:hypothetical protein
VITKLFGTDIPIIQAPMAGVQDSVLAATVSNAGGLGSLPCAMFRPHLEVRFQKPLTTLQLTAYCFAITNNQTRHKLGLYHPALLHREIPLPFFSLLATFPVEHPTHNRALYHSS